MEKQPCDQCRWNESQAHQTLKEFPVCRLQASLKSKWSRQHPSLHRPKLNFSLESRSVLSTVKSILCTCETNTPYSIIIYQLLSFTALFAGCCFMKICVDRERSLNLLYVYLTSKTTNTTTIKCVRGCSGSTSPSLRAQEENVLPRWFTFYNLHGEVN